MSNLLFYLFGEYIYITGSKFSWEKTMNKTVRIIYILFLVSLPLIAQTAVIGEGHFEMGGVYPQGDYVKYADPGFTLNFRGTLHIPKFKAVSGWGDFSFDFFSEEESPVEITVENFVYLGEETISEYAISTHLGLQLGSSSRRGTIRPRLSGGPGLYIFNTGRKYRIYNTEDYFGKQNDTQTKLGWRLIAGLDLFINTRVGLSFNYMTDYVHDLNHTLEYENNGSLVRTGKAARFDHFMIGVVFDFGKNR